MLFGHAGEDDIYRVSYPSNYLGFEPSAGSASRIQKVTVNIQKYGIYAVLPAFILNVRVHGEEARCVRKLFDAPFDRKHEARCAHRIIRCFLWSHKEKTKLAALASQFSAPFGSFGPLFETKIIHNFSSN